MFPYIIFVIFAPRTRLLGKFLLHTKIKHQPEIHLGGQVGKLLVGGNKWQPGRQPLPGRHLGGQVEPHDIQHLCQHWFVHMPDIFRHFGVLWLV